MWLLVVGHQLFLEAVKLHARLFLGHASKGTDLVELRGAHFGSRMADQFWGCGVGEEDHTDHFSVAVCGSSL